MFDRHAPPIPLDYTLYLNFYILILYLLYYNFYILIIRSVKRYDRRENSPIERRVFSCENNDNRSVYNTARTAIARGGDEMKVVSPTPPPHNDEECVRITVRVQYTVSTRTVLFFFHDDTTRVHRESSDHGDVSRMCYRYYCSYDQFRSRYAIIRDINSRGYFLT